MANTINANGITIETYAQIVSNIVNGTSSAPGYLQIYGTDINIASNSPDGQMINIYALAKQDVLNLCVQIYNSFDPDQAVGVALDSIAQIAGLTRKAGTYTQVAITITVSQNLNLQGLDTTTPFTVQDATGNQFFLIVSASLTTGANTLNFQSSAIGFIQVLANTLTIPVTIVAGVTSVNNALTPYTVGSNQETDSNFRLRRQASTAFPAQGAMQALYAGLASISGVGYVAVYENTTNAVNSDGVPAHGIWVVTQAGATTDIANAIYKYRNMGCPMAGAVTSNITQVDGSIFAVNWDTAVPQNLFVQFHLTSINGSAIDTTALKTALAANYLLGIYQPADISTLDAQIRAINPNVVVSSLGVSSLAAYYATIIYPTLKKNFFVLTTANISII